MDPQKVKEELLEKVEERFKKVKQRGKGINDETIVGLQKGAEVAHKAITDFFEEENFGVSYQVEIDNSPAKEAISEIEAQVEDLQNSLKDLGLDLEVLTPDEK